MPRGRWTTNEEQVAEEAYAVLIERRKPTRTYTRAGLMTWLTDEAVYGDFLKLCLEHDDSKDLASFRKGLLMVVRAMGPDWMARSIGVSRVSLYRMLSPGGNPRFKNLMALLRRLRVRLWIVDEAFIERRSAVVRPKDKKQVEIEFKNKWEAI